MKPGDCIAIKDVGGGCGFSTDEIRAKDEFGAFLVAFTNAPKVFATSAACLQDLAANGGR